jgi:serine/threonine-protein kinase HipA
MVRATQGVSLRYSQDWQRRGFALSEDLPLISNEFFPVEKATCAGAVDDARPDRWGERVIRVLEKPPRLSLLEYLYFAGDDRFGALGISTSRDRYRPHTVGALPTLADVQSVHQLVQKVIDNEPINERERRLIAPGATMGGAKPKALITIEDSPWVVKFSDGDAVDTALVEHASMTLAETAKIRVAQTRPIRLTVGNALAIKRFDRVGARRLHALSANVALKAAGEDLGYPELGQLLRRKGVTQGGQNVEHMHELFRRMVFNILLDNTDDHEKNHALLIHDNEQYALSPAYDVLPSGQAIGYQQMRVGHFEADSTIDNALSMSAMFDLKLPAARAEVASVAAVVANWRTHFRSCGVTSRDIESLAEQIDRPFLKDQRDAALPRRRKK